MFMKMSWRTATTLAWRSDAAAGVVSTEFNRCLRARSGDLARLTAVMKDCLHSDVPLLDEMQDNYFIGGKQLRAIVALLSARLHGLDAGAGGRVAAAIEFIHTATLLHDDVVDDAALRRHLPTAKRAYGNEAAVLAGDFLYSRASQIFAQIGNVELLRQIADVTNQLAEGELLQLLQRGRPDISEADYFTIIRKKTANLFAVTAAAAAILRGRESGAVAAFGLHLGMAFQLVDDCLDYEGAGSGKQLGADLREGKMTLPVILMLGRVAPARRQQIVAHWVEESKSARAARGMTAAAKVFPFSSSDGAGIVSGDKVGGGVEVVGGGDEVVGSGGSSGDEVVGSGGISGDEVIGEDFFAEVVGLMRETGSLAAARGRAQQEIGRAVAALASYPDSSAKQDLIAIAESSPTRQI